MLNNIGSEILINARQVTSHQQGSSYEFILNNELRVLECVKVESMIRGIITPIKNITQTLDGLLFELNHVRVNPKLDNTIIINSLTTALRDIGVTVTNPPYYNSMATCYKPLGEISDNVRFYLNKEAILVLLSPSVKLKVINCQAL